MRESRLRIYGKRTEGLGTGREINKLKEGAGIFILPGLC